MTESNIIERAIDMHRSKHAYIHSIIQRIDLTSKWSSTAEHVVEIPSHPFESFMMPAIEDIRHEDNEKRGNILRYMLHVHELS